MLFSQVSFSYSVLFGKDSRIQELIPCTTVGYQVTLLVIQVRSILWESATIRFHLCKVMEDDRHNQIGILDRNILNGRSTCDNICMGQFTYVIRYSSTTCESGDVIQELLPSTPTTKSYCWSWYTKSQHSHISYVLYAVPFSPFSLMEWKDLRSKMMHNDERFTTATLFCIILVDGVLDHRES